MSLRLYFPAAFGKSRNFLPLNFNSPLKLASSNTFNNTTAMLPRPDSSLLLSFLLYLTLSPLHTAIELFRTILRFLLLLYLIFGCYKLQTKVLLWSRYVFHCTRMLSIAISNAKRQHLISESHLNFLFYTMFHIKMDEPLLVRRCDSMCILLVVLFLEFCYKAMVKVTIGTSIRRHLTRTTE